MTLTDQAAQKIKHMIVAGVVAPGEKLPPEAELASMLGLSRSSLREAVRALTFVGILRTRQGDGTYVTDLHAQALLETLDFLVDVADGRTMLEFFQVRRLLEPVATGLAVGKLDDACFEALRACLARMDDAETAEEFIEADLEFHYTIVGSVGNEALSRLVRTLGGRSVRTHAFRARTEEGALQRARDGHRAIFDALQARDPELARAATTIHLADGELWLRRALDLEAPG